MAGAVRCCVPRCGKTRKRHKTVLHSFPNPNADMERYTAWTRAVGSSVSCLVPQYVYKNRRVCHDHFEGKYLSWTRILRPVAVPTLLLPAGSGKSFENLESTSTKQSPEETKEQATEAKDPVIGVGIQEPVIETTREEVDTQEPVIDTTTEEVETEELVQYDNCLVDEESVTHDYTTAAYEMVEEPNFSWNKLDVAIPIEDNDAASLVPGGYEELDSQVLTLNCETDENGKAEITEDNYKCNNCSAKIISVRYTCVQCLDYDLCPRCDAAGEHCAHYVLRVPPHKQPLEVREVILCIRRRFGFEGDAKDLTLSDNISVKEETEDEPKSPVSMKLSDDDDEEDLLEDTVDELDEDTVEELDQNSVLEDTVDELDEDTVEKLDEKSVLEDNVDELDEDTVEELDQHSVLEDNVDELDEDSVEELDQHSVLEDTVDELDEYTVEELDQHSVLEDNVDELDEDTVEELDQHSVLEDNVDGLDEDAVLELYEAPISKYPLRFTGPMRSADPLDSTDPPNPTALLRSSSRLHSSVSKKPAGRLHNITVPLYSTGSMTSTGPLHAAVPPNSTGPMRPTGPLHSTVPSNSTGHIRSKVPLHSKGPNKTAGPLDSTVPLRVTRGSLHSTGPMSKVPLPLVHLPGPMRCTSPLNSTCPMESSDTLHSKGHAADSPPSYKTRKRNYLLILESEGRKIKRVILAKKKQ